jgi:hypothetical protein
MKYSGSLQILYNINLHYHIIIVLFNAQRNADNVPFEIQAIWSILGHRKFPVRLIYIFLLLSYYLVSRNADNTLVESRWYHGVIGCSQCVLFEIQVHKMWKSGYKRCRSHKQIVSGSHHLEVGHMRLYSIMINIITFHNDRKYCGRSQAIAGVITDHHIFQNSLMQWNFEILS